MGWYPRLKGQFEQQIKKKIFATQPSLLGIPILWQKITLESEPYLIGMMNAGIQGEFDIEINYETWLPSLRRKS